MINILIGKKGSGKTKKLIECANQAVANSNGNVVVIEKGLKLTYDISHKARLIDSDAYAITGLDAMEGFLCGICAGNYDVTDILIDSTLKIIGQDMAALSALIVKIKKLAEEANVTFTLSISADESEVPEDVLAVATKL